MKHKVEVSPKYDIWYEISWHDGLGRYISEWTCDFPVVRGAYILPDDHTGYPGINVPDPKLSHTIRELLYLNFYQSVKEQEAKIKAQEQQNAVHDNDSVAGAVPAGDAGGGNGG